ncbi:MAG: 5-(carboxyamino)imidazole ribonucleotide mutase [Candidatus Aminicenantales bacterium]
MKIGIFIGSDSDYDVIKDAVDLLKKFAVPFRLEVTSAHRTPKRTIHLLEEFEREGAAVFIVVAGKAAHLAGVVAAHTLCPVIGVPAGGQRLGGLDALLSTVQMPRGIPVACMGIGSSGGVNAALLALQILALEDGTLRKKLEDFRTEMASHVEESSKRIQEKL